MKAEITVSPSIANAARKLLELHDKRFDEARIHVDARLRSGAWHEGSPVEGPAREGQHHPLEGTL